MVDPIIAELAFETGKLDSFGDFVWDPVTPLVPSFDFKDGHAFFTIPVQRTVIKKGKTKADPPRSTVETQLVLVRDDGWAQPFTEEVVQKLGFIFPKTVMVPDKMRWHPHSVRAFNNRQTHKVDSTELFNEIHDVLRKYVEYPADIYYELVALFIMTSYMFQIWASTGYIHFNGTAASGKSRNLDLIELMGLNAKKASNISEASLFRTIEGSPGVVLIDEAEDFKSERGDVIRRLLNDGYTRNGAAIRVDKNADSELRPQSYRLYCPKVIASISSLENVLASRSIIIPMVPALRRIPELPEDGPDSMWQQLRDRLYIWALGSAKKTVEAAALWNTTKRYDAAPDIINRQWQVSQAYFTMTELIHVQGLTDRLRDFFNGYFFKQQRNQDDTDRTRLILRCLPRVLATQSPRLDTGMYLSKDIHEVVSAYLETDQLEWFKIRAIATAMTVLGFHDRKGGKGGMAYRLDEDQIRDAFLHRHVAPFDEDLPWLNDKVDWSTPVILAPIETTHAKPTQEGFDFLNDYLEDN